MSKGFIVDRCFITQFGLTEFLKNNNFQVEGASDSIESLQNNYQKAGVDFLFLDAGIKGIDFFIRECKIPSVIYYSSKKEVMNYQKASNVLLMQKPVCYYELADNLKQFLANRVKLSIAS